MKDFDKFLGLGSIKPTREQRKSMRQIFEIQILTVALRRGKISQDRYEELVNRRIGINFENRKTALK